jgi:hypothetical protein
MSRVTVLPTSAAAAQTARAWSHASCSSKSCPSADSLTLTSATDEPWPGPISTGFID